MEKKNTARVGLCSNACPGRGRRRRRPCSSVGDAPVSCASGKRKHGLARARAPQRSTLKEHVPRPGWRHSRTRVSSSHLTSIKIRLKQGRTTNLLGIFSIFMSPLSGQESSFSHLTSIEMHQNPRSCTVDVSALGPSGSVR